MFSVTKNFWLVTCVGISASCFAAPEKAKNTKPSPAPQPSSASKTSATPSAIPVAEGKKMDPVQACKYIFQKFGIPWQQLWQKRGQDLRDEHTNGLSRLADMTAEHCTEDGPRKEVTEVLSKLLNQHTGKIGVLLPLASKPITRNILRGIEAAVKNAHLEPQTTLVSLDTQGNSQKIEALLAQLLYRDQVSVVIGGFDSNDVEILRQWSAKLVVPVFILNEPVASKPMPAGQAPLVYYSHPTEQGLAKALVTANERYRHKKISIMRPNDQHADRLVQNYEQLAKATGMTVMHSVVYDPRRIDQMESAARKLFKLETTDRRDELKRLYEQAKEHAAATGQPFNAKMVALQPVVEQDAVFIADDFRTVRHMAKVFTYLGVRKLPMFGGYEWRSEGLVEPFDPLFSGSYFVDFMGSYLNLPQALRVPTTSSPYFIAPDQIEEVDFTTLGFRSTLTPLALIKHTETARRKLDKWIQRTTAKTTSKEITFDENNVISWPTYLFEVTSQGKNGTITLQP